LEFSTAVTPLLTVLPRSKESVDRLKIFKYCTIDVYRWITSTIIYFRSSIPLFLRTETAAVHLNSVFYCQPCVRVRHDHGECSSCVSYLYLFIRSFKTFWNCMILCIAPIVAPRPPRDFVFKCLPPRTHDSTNDETKHW
jgi:hypothetical protein